MKIFVINLERAAERRKTALQRLHELGMDAEILHAVDGASLERNTLDPDAEPGLSDGEVGCYLSHVRAWQAIVDRRLDQAIVLEDDVVCDPAMIRIANEIVALGLPLDAVRLSALQPIRGLTIAHLSGDHCLLLPNKNPSGAQGYMVTQQGAQHLLQKLPVPRLPIDDAFDAYWKHGLCIPIVSPCLVFEDHNFPSSIVHRFGSDAPKSLGRHLARVAESKRRKLMVFLMARRLHAKLAHAAREQARP